MTRYNFENQSPGVKKLLTGEMRIPAFFLGGSEQATGEEFVEKVEELGGNPDLSQHITVLSDAHLKPGIANPTGGIVASKDTLLPEMMDAAPNCGMRVILSDLTEKELTPEKIDRLFSGLRQAIPSQKLVGTAIADESVIRTLIQGSRALESAFPIRTKDEFENTYKQGNFFDPDGLPSEAEIRSAIPSFILKIARYRLGLLGATKSHFLHLMKVTRIHEVGLAGKIGLREGQYVFFLHTGSSVVGRYTASLYTRRRIKSLSQRLILAIIRWLSPAPLRKIFLSPKKTGTPEAAKFETAMRAVCNYGFANRTLITSKLHSVLEKVFGKSINLALLYDSPHVYLDQETHGGQKLWIHRNGANRAFGPKKMQSHPIFRETGEPVLIAPFADGVGYIAVGTDRNEISFSSANHEIGKAKELELSDAGFRNYRQKITDGISESDLAGLVAELEVIKTLTY